MDLGVLLSVPLESVAIRAVIASVLGVIVVRTLLRSGLRSPQARVLAAAVPLVALLVVTVLSGAQPRLPTLMLPADGAHVLSVPVRDGFVHFMPIAVPVIAGVWGALAGARLLRRGLGVLRVRRAAQAAVAASAPLPAGLARLARDTAMAMAVPIPQVGIVDRCRGGAYVVGTRRPVLIVGRDLLDVLDTEELEGVVAHELAHVQRRDTLVATTLGVVRDLMFFVPGGAWAVRQLHREREIAADQAAVEVTGRPGALASGLLKVLEAGPGATQPCATFAPGGSVVDRVRLLVTDQPPVTRHRRLGEAVAVAAVTSAAVVVAIAVPTALTGTERQRDAVAVVWAPVTAADQPALDPAAEARAFDVYRRSSFDVDEPLAAATPRFDDDAAENRRSTLRACAAGTPGCPAPGPGISLGLQPQPTVVEVDLGWRATPVADRLTTDGLQLFWLARVQ